MRLSKRGEYGLRAMMALAVPGPDGKPPVLQIREIAEREQMPGKFLEQILLDLKKAGILDSRRGKSGGYAMLRPADTVSFGEILRLFDGPLAPLPCLSRNAYRRCEDCVNEAQCEIRREFGRAFDASRQVLDSRTLADALGNSAYTPEIGHEVRRAG